MSTPEELIQAGIVPTSAPNAGAMAGEPPAEIVADIPAIPLTEQEKQHLEAEVLFDWDHIPTNRLKAKRVSDPDYAAALERCAAAGFAGTPFVASIGEDGNYHFDAKDKTTEPVVTPSAEVPPPPPAPVVPEVPVVVPAPAAEIADPNDPYIKTNDGWEVRIDLEDGGGVQIFKGRTKTELSKKLVKAQFNATKEIRRRNREREVMNEFDVTKLDLDRVAPLAPVTISADELFTLTNDLRDPATSRKAFQKLLAAEVSDPTSALGSRIRRADEMAAFESSKELAKTWVRKNSAFYNDPAGENIQTVYRFFVKHALEVTEKNLDAVFNVLKTKGALLEVFPIEPDSATAGPTAGLPVVPAAVAAAVPASVVPAAPVTPAAVPVLPATSPAPVPLSAARVRPGSVTTGMSPRQASVRPGVSAATPVGLTVEEYRKTPTNEIKRRYQTDLGFRQGVDKLIAEGKI